MTASTELQLEAKAPEWLEANTEVAGARQS